RQFHGTSPEGEVLGGSVSSFMCERLRDVREGVGRARELREAGTRPLLPAENVQEILERSQRRGELATRTSGRGFFDRQRVRRLTRERDGIGDSGECRV